MKREIDDGQVSEERELCALEREAKQKERVEGIPIWPDEVEVFEAWERR